ncbi:dolichyl-phosphate-mannose-protein mannosyltransferase [Entomortierella parvispora]|uniref:Dolichyl-phosphate-mannose--protein mannosyltransferase n=1 Tax=Entomortierella parvispora TaxID=205924 RepID=A0A9P3H214_9FUNG|nr:dolichyl-phosphate-mannose-protein mannosyltransferase [Entomortierella parvispora]
MRNGSSSAVDQTGVPVYRGHATPRTVSKETMEDSNYSPRHHGADLKARSSLDVSRDAPNAKEDEEDYSHSKFRTRRSLPWYQSRELQIVGAITVLAAVVRLWAIGYPTSVVFDEVHFGGFASKYIRGRFFMDVHPPLAKMLIALTGWIFGLDPSFDFKDIGMDYIEPKVPYIPMRMMCGLMGVAVVPMAFYTVRNSGHSLHASILAALLVLFENSITAQSRLILLDSPLILFTAFTVLAWVNFHNQRHDPFSDDWFVWLFMTGLGLGLSGSVKWVGLFIIATIGTSTLNQLWTLWGDLKVSPRVWVNHFIARAICLIAVPVVVYMFMFEIHFLLLGNGGEGDGFMSAPFQMTLGHSLKDSPLGVAYGATVSMRHQGTQGGYLHSHPSNYETGSKQQQITLYPHKDTNNEWILQKRDGTVPEGLEYIKHGDYVRLLHAQTFKRLHSHDKKPPMTEDENHFEVSGYGYKDFEGDANDEWRVEIVDRDGSDPEASTSLHTLRSKFKLVHINMNCDLFSHKVKLPKWGFEQQEVTCMRSAVVGKTIWMIESNHHDSYPADAPLVNYKKPGFFGKFIELNKVMWTTNAGLTDSHPYDSRPSSWPIMKRGISFWGKEQKHVYLVGNWFTWYLSTFSVVLYAAIRGLLFIRDKRGYKDDFKGLREYYELSGGFFFMGWCYHYLPFFLMDRQLFLHHYLPALYFSILLLAVTFDLGCRFLPNRFRVLAMILVASTAIYVFRSYAPLTYGSEWTRSECEASKVLKTWDYDCNQYPTDYAQYVANKAAVAPAENNNDQSSTLNEGGSSFLEQAVPVVEAISVPEIHQDNAEDIHQQQAAPDAAAAEAAQITDKAVSNEDLPGAHLDEEYVDPTYDFEVDSPEEEEEEDEDEEDEE